MPSKSLEQKPTEQPSRVRNCYFTIRVSHQQTAQVPVRLQPKCGAKDWFSHWLHSKLKVLKKHKKNNCNGKTFLFHLIILKSLIYIPMISFNISILIYFWILLFPCPNSHLLHWWNVGQIAVFTSTTFQSQFFPLGVSALWWETIDYNVLFSLFNCPTRQDISIKLLVQPR